MPHFEARSLLPLSFCQRKDIYQKIRFSLEVQTDWPLKLIKMDAREASVATINLPTRVFGLLVFSLTVLLVVCYCFIRPSQSLLDLRGLIHSSFLGMLTVIGFSLVQLYRHDKPWTVLPSNLLLVSLAFLMYFCVNFIIVYGVNPLGKSPDEVDGDIAVSSFTTNDFRMEMEFNDGQTVLAAFRFCVAAVVGCTALNMDVMVLFLLVVTVCPFYVFNRLALLAMRFVDRGGTIQLFAFAGAFAFTLELLVRYHEIFKEGFWRRRQNRLGGVEHALMVVGGVFVWTLMPFIMETNVVSTDYSTNVQTANPTAVVQQSNLWGSMFSSILGVLIAESNSTTKEFRFQNLVYALICSSLTICTAAEFITMPFLTTVIGLVLGFGYNTLFQYFYAMKREQYQELSAQHRHFEFRNKLNRQIKYTFENSGNSVFGFVLTGALGSLLALFLSLIQMIQWLNPRWPDPDSFDSVRQPKNTVGIILAAVAVSCLIGIIAAFATLGVFKLLNKRNFHIFDDSSSNFMELEDDYQN